MFVLFSAILFVASFLVHMAVDVWRPKFLNDIGQTGRIIIAVTLIAVAAVLTVVLWRKPERRKSLMPWWVVVMVLIVGLVEFWPPNNQLQFAAMTQQQMHAQLKMDGHDISVYNAQVTNLNQTAAGMVQSAQTKPYSEAIAADAGQVQDIQVSITQVAIQPLTPVTLWTIHGLLDRAQAARDDARSQLAKLEAAGKG